MRLLIYLSILAIFACGSPGEPVIYEQEKDTSRVRMHTLSEILNRTSQVRAAALSVKPGSFDTIPASGLNGTRLRVISQNLDLLEEWTVTEGTILAYIRDSLNLQDSLFFVDNGLSIIPVGLQDTINISGTIVVTDSVQFLVDSITAHRTEINALHDSITSLRQDIGTQALDTLWFYDNGSTVTLVAQGDTIMITASEASAEAIASVGNYTQLRALTGYVNDLVFVRDTTYTAYNDSSYTTKGGLFKKVASGSENGGTIIVGGNGDIWERFWDGVQVKPEWWEVGGYDHNGLAFVDRNTSTNAGVRDGIGFESDRINSAIKIGQILVLESREYTIRSQVNMPTGSLVIQGGNAVLKRAPSISSPLTTPVSSSATALPVSDASLFHVGMRIDISDTSATNGGKGYHENLASTSVFYITSISGNTINISNPIPSGFDAGDIVFQKYDMLGSNSTGLYENLVVKDLTIDGNRAQNDITYDWRINHDFSPGDATGHLTCENVIFKNASTTSAFPNKGNFTYCEWKDCNGAAVHIGSTTSKGIYFNNCKFTNLVEVSATVAQHTEGAITFSVGVTPLYITNCDFQNIGASIFAPVSFTDTAGVYMRGCYAENCSGVFSQSTSTTDVAFDNIMMQNNYLKSCGDISINGRNVRQGYSDYRFQIVDNIIINTRIYASHVSQFLLEGNFIAVDESDSNYVAWTSATSGQEAFIQFINFDEIKIKDNTIAGPNTNNAFIRNGLLLQHNDLLRKDTNGVSTQYIYPQKVEVSGNTIYNFTSGITSYQEFARLALPKYQCVGWTYDNNKIYGTKDIINANDTYGMFVDNGVIATNNKIYMHPGSYAGMLVAGVYNESGQSREDSLMGGIAINNFIFNSSGQAVRLAYAGSSQFQSNIIFRNNYYQGNVNKPRALSTLDTMNVSIDGTTFVDMTSPKTPEYQHWKENSGVY